MTRLNRDTLTLYDALKADGIEFEMHRSGLLFVFRTEVGLRGVLDDVGAMAALCGYEQPDALTANEVRLLEPGLSQSISGGLLVAEERHIRPETLTAGLVKRLRELGVEIQSGLGVTGFHKRGGRVNAVTTSARVFEADQFLIAAGVWSDRLAKQLGCFLPLQAGTGYSVTVRNPPVRFQHSLYLFEVKLACSPFSGALRIAGTLDLCGLDATVDQGRIASITRSADGYLDGWRGENGEDAWMGMRPPGADNVYVATGHAMLGITLAPATAVAVADAMCSGKDDPELAAFSPGRFAP
jgi:D-amino-acid dehydrogenase